MAVAPRLLIVVFVGCAASLSTSVARASAPPAASHVLGFIEPKADPNTQRLKSLLAQPDERIDLAKVKVAIDHMLDSTVDEASTLKEVDMWADRVRSRIPAGATDWTKLLVLASTLYQSGPWNENHKFTYNFDDPFGKDVHTSELSTYLATHRGNCVSMPIFFAILARRIGLNITIATAPNHILVKFKLDSGKWVNVEATSGSSVTDEEYQKMFLIEPRAIAAGVYLRPLTNRESVVAMAAPLLVYYDQNHAPEEIIALTDLSLAYDSNNLVALTVRAMAYFNQANVVYRKKYPNFGDLPPELQADHDALMVNYFTIANRVKALGWHPRTAEQDAEYVQAIKDAKKAENGG